MSIRGKDRRNAVSEKLFRFLWGGDVPAADLKNKKWHDSLLEYFEKRAMP